MLQTQQELSGSAEHNTKKTSTRRPAGKSTQQGHRLRHLLLTPNQNKNMDNLLL